MFTMDEKIYETWMATYRKCIEVIKAEIDNALDERDEEKFNEYNILYKQMILFKTEMFFVCRKEGSDEIEDFELF